MTIFGDTVLCLVGEGTPAAMCATANHRSHLKQVMLNSAHFVSVGRLQHCDDDKTVWRFGVSYRSRISS